jgi:hypothetical protein
VFPVFEAPPSLPETMRESKYRMAAVGPYSSNTQLVGVVEDLLGTRLKRVNRHGAPMPIGTLRY